MLLSGSLAPALRTGALVGMIELREAQSAPRQRQPSAVREPWSASAGVSRAARSTSPTSARAPSNGPRGGELAIVVGATRGQTSGPYDTGRVALRARRVRAPRARDREPRKGQL